MLQISTAANFHESVTAALTVFERCIHVIVVPLCMSEKRRKEGEWMRVELVVRWTMFSLNR